MVAEGGPGDRFRVVREGHAEVTVHGHPRRTLGPGDGFGEIALLRDVPRTATIRARSDSRLWAVSRRPFLAALGATPEALTAATGAVEEHLARRPLLDPP